MVALGRHMIFDPREMGIYHCYARCVRRASDRGVLEMNVEQYLKFLDWVGRQLRRGKRGKIDANAPPILERLGLSSESFVAFIESYDELFRLAVGSAKSLAEFE